MGKIGRPGSNPGPKKTSFVGASGGRGVGNRTSAKSGANMNRDESAALKRKPLNAGPGGTQIA